MNEPDNRSVTAWISDLKQGDNDAARLLWERYFRRLVQMARRRLGNASRRVADEEDVALSVFGSLCRGAEQGRFTQLTDRDDLWRLLMVITRQKSVDQVRRNTSQKRGSGNVRGDSIVMDRIDGVGGFERFVAQDPTPEFLATLDEEHDRLFGLLRDDTQREIARLRMEGYSNEDISQELGVSMRTVERKLNVIRETWSEEVRP